MLLPALSTYDPRLTAEGSLDPLGFVSTSDRLADAIWPDVTIRMRRARFLTGIAVMSVVSEPFREELAADEISPAHQVFEWYVVEAQARLRARLEPDTYNFPGTDKARRAVEARLGLSADRYLKMPSVFGFYGVYKRLARGLGIVEDDLYLCEGGMRLLQGWEKDRGFRGFSDPTCVDGPGPAVRSMWQEAVRDGLRKGATSRSGGWQGWEVLVEHLRLDGIGHAEQEVLRSLLTAQEKGTQAEYFSLLSQDDVPALWKATGYEDEKTFYERFRRSASTTLAEHLDAITAYEAVTRILDDAWRLILHLSTVRSPAPLTGREFANALPDGHSTGHLTEVIDKAGLVLQSGPAQEHFEALTRPFLGLQSKEELFAAILERHRAVQDAKPPDGKRPWVEMSGSGGVLVRAPYRRPDPPAYDGSFVNPYRTVAVASLLDDLKPDEG